MSFINVEKGFKLKGVIIGEVINGGMVIGIDDEMECNIVDIAILKDKPTGEQPMSQVTMEDVYGLEEYKDCENIEWIDSCKLS